MGCSVYQSEDSTTVTGPPPGTLLALPHVDMETMTDAFLTASVLAAVADGKTQITGIANQRVKECNRIVAMKDQLAKFGVQCTELDDGIEIFGKPLAELRVPKEGIHCYDDHRVAMSFSVLSVVSPGPVVVTERECVGKTWPGWWDTLSQSFKVKLEGSDTDANTQHILSSDGDLQRSIFIIGMRGAGKTTAGNWMARLLQWKFIDLDQELERRSGKSIPEMVEGPRGWVGFRADEAALLRDVMDSKPRGHVISCGGGIVETSEARALLLAFGRSGGRVVQVHRNIDQLGEYLARDKSRPAFTTSKTPEQVYLEREPWYRECSNYLYYSPHAGDLGCDARIPDDFQRFVSFIRGEGPQLATILEKKHSFFVSLTFPDLAQALEKIPRVAVGSDAIELRVDLLENKSLDAVSEQVSILRHAVSIPIIFTVRTESQGGKFPDNLVQERLDLYRLALKLAVSYLDVEVTSSDDIWQVVTNSQRHTVIIASHHDISGSLSWRNASWIEFFNRALQYGDIIKLVGVALTMEDNFHLDSFKARMSAAHKTPLIAINMGAPGRLSRVLNGFLTPVSHPCLPEVAAPGQMSAAEIWQGLTLLGEVKPLSFYLVGTPISQSRSPALHNSLFQRTGLPHRYELRETNQEIDFRSMLQSDGFGGASVTIPLKQQVTKIVDALTPAAKKIGAVNTVVPLDDHIRDPKCPRRFLGDNTDWKGIVYVLSQNARYMPSNGSSTLVVGSGGTTRAAIYALHSMGFRSIYILARDPNKAKRLAAEFPDYNVQVLVGPSDVKNLKHAPAVIISTIPADKPVDSTVDKVLVMVLSLASLDGTECRILLDMAYKPHCTPVMQMAKHAADWKVVSGLDVLASQGCCQFTIWTGIEPLYNDALDAVLGIDAKA
ncbi:hypothetical protein DCS_03717 [Drechmeria coniospora]|uniref:3-phosphoshikimate 1-carboxyvinyltransferase n=1 Tax=Drechmeria coniospora TaxID=98403 RepID=A0A151GI53_DRECN|nr:hypothetical protein DCS_03717 [Drechmeria coniospora]KYK56712.1 hypothetical protein DCS_03717 [Drechmeria coniospora]